MSTPDHFMDVDYTPRPEQVVRLVLETANRDDVARWLWKRDGYSKRYWERATALTQGSYFREADELLALLGGKR